MITKFKIYIKTHESYSIETDKGYFYFIPYDNTDLILLAIDKIDTSQENKEIIKNKLKSIDYSKLLGVYVGFTENVNATYTKEEDYYTCYGKHDIEDGYREYINDPNTNYEYRGEIKLEPYEIDSFKYNI